MHIRMLYLEAGTSDKGGGGGGGGVPSGTLESPLSTSRARTLARSSTVHLEAENTETAMFGRVYSFSSSACQCRHMHDPLSSRLEIVVAPLIS